MASFSRRNSGFSNRSSLQLSDRSQLALARANTEAMRLKHKYVGTEHILLGLLKEKGGQALRIVAELGPELDALRTNIEAASPPGTEPVIASGPLAYTDRAKKVLELAAAEARAAGRETVGTADLLLGLVLQNTGVAAQVLRRLGVEADHVRKVAGRFHAAVAPQAPASSFRIHLDDASDRSIYEQIVSAVQEAVATNELRGGERMPTVRQMADELDIAPGTVARAYGELERLGVIIADGARGTRVAPRARLSMPHVDRPQMLEALLRPVAVSAFHLGASAEELRAALDNAMKDIFQKIDVA
jgi:DNA-binding transcriptional regulator YhcF (GntR family)